MIIVLIWNNTDHPCKSNVMLSMTLILHKDQNKHEEKIFLTSALQETEPCIFRTSHTCDQDNYETSQGLC